MEVPVGKMVAPELLRGQDSFSLIRDLGETFAQRGCLMSQSQDSCGSFRVAVKEALEDLQAQDLRESWRVYFCEDCKTCHKPHCSR